MLSPIHVSLLAEFLTFKGVPMHTHLHMSTVVIADIWGAFSSGLHSEWSHSNYLNIQVVLRLLTHSFCSNSNYLSQRWIKCALTWTRLFELTINKILQQCVCSCTTSYIISRLIPQFLLFTRSNKLFVDFPDILRHWG